MGVLLLQPGASPRREDLQLGVTRGVLTQTYPEPGVDSLYVEQKRFEGREEGRLAAAERAEEVVPPFHFIVGLPSDLILIPIGDQPLLRRLLRHLFIPCDEIDLFLLHFFQFRLLRKIQSG